MAAEGGHTTWCLVESAKCRPDFNTDADLEVMEEEGGSKFGGEVSCSRKGLELRCKVRVWGIELEGQCSRVGEEVTLEMRMTSTWINM